MKIRISCLFGLILMCLMNVQAQDDYSHSNETAPDYAIVFPQDAVNTITISIDPAIWQVMQDDMTELYGEFGSRPLVNSESPEAEEPPFIPIRATDKNPIWVTADISFEGATWANVGIRYKGSSSLMTGWALGNYKLPFRLDFDEFEDTYPEIENQRFFGFKELSFSNNWSDDSFLREKVTADTFREAGLVASHTAFYAVYVDYGEAPLYFGLYTAVEVIDDTVIETQFDDDSGNLYKPDGLGATFGAGLFDEESFDKETNEDEADYSDILALYEALHAETRLSNPEVWRTNLEAVFDADSFIKWLAVNTLVQNWDTYGRMAHNYYLYNNPSSGQLVWIPWDNNMALYDGFSDPRLGGPNMGALNLELDTVTDDWPLIRFLMDDPVYRALYVTYLEESMNGAFEPSKMEATYTYYHELIAPYVLGENGEIENHGYLSSDAAFEQALEDLISHAHERHASAEAYIVTQPRGKH